MTASRSILPLASILLAAGSCGGQTPEPPPICARAQILAIDAVMVTPTGRVLARGGEGWTIGQLEVDGALTPVTELASSRAWLFVGAWLDHDPASGRMWLLEGAEWGSGDPPMLYQLGPDAQIEWSLALDSYARPVAANTLRYHEGSLYLALTMDGFWPEDPAEPSVPRSLVLERRDLDGQVIWTRSDYAPPNTHGELSSALLVGFSGSALAMVATPPLIDYGPSYPLSVDVETGDVRWSGEQGHDPLRMAVAGGGLAVAWVTPTDYDMARWPEEVVLGPSSSSLSLHDPLTGAQANLSEVEWPALEWRYVGGLGDASFQMGRMGAQLVSIVEADGEHGVAVHDADGELLCEGRLDVEFDGLGRAVGLEGRGQLVVDVSVLREDSTPDDPIHDWGLMLIEPAP